MQQASHQMSDRPRLLAVVLHSPVWMIVGKKKFCYIVDVCVEIEPRLSEEVMCRFRFVHHISKAP